MALLTLLMNADRWIETLTWAKVPIILTDILGIFLRAWFCNKRRRLGLSAERAPFIPKPTHPNNNGDINNDKEAEHLSTDSI